MTTRATHGLVDLIDGYLQVPEVTAPGTPASAKVRIYAKSDGHLYIKDDAGTEYDLTAALNGVTAASALADNEVPKIDGASRAVQASGLYLDDVGVDLKAHTVHATGATTPLTLQSGNSTSSGDSGNVTLDSGSVASGTGGTANIGTANAESVNIGRSTKNTDIKGTVSSGAITSSSTVAGTNLRNTLHFPPGQQCANLTATCAYNDGEAKFVYLGRARAAITTLTLRYRVTTAYVDGGSDWAEVAVFKGNPSMGGNASLTLMGYTDVSAVVNSTGQKSTAITLTGVAAGDELWACLGQNGNGTKFVLRGCLADDLQTGYFQTASVQPSAAASPEGTTLGGATAVPPWCAVEW